MKNPKGYDVFSLYDDDYPQAAEGKVDPTDSKVPPGNLGPSVSSCGVPGATNKPGEMNIGGKPSSPQKPGGDVNIGGNK